jgi:hypothetical protein
MNRQIFVILSFAMIIFHSNPSRSDEWNDFYLKNGNKFFVTTFSSQTIYSDGSKRPIFTREFGFSVISPNKVRRIGRDTNIATGELTDNYDYIIEKGSVLYRNSNLSVAFDVEKNKMTLTLLNNRGVKEAEFITVVNGKTCRSSFNYLVSFSNYVIENKNMTCKVIE